MYHFLIIFQAGYAPWPSIILTFNKNKSTATVQYFGFEYYIGKIKCTELVQLDEDSKDAIGSLIGFTMENRCIREFGRFEKAVREIEHIMINIGAK